MSNTHSQQVTNAQSQATNMVENSTSRVCDAPQHTVNQSDVVAPLDIHTANNSRDLLYRTIYSATRHSILHQLNSDIIQGRWALPKFHRKLSVQAARYTHNGIDKLAHTNTQKVTKSLQTKSPQKRKRAGAQLKTIAKQQKTRKKASAQTLNARSAKPKVRSITNLTQKVLRQIVLSKVIAPRWFQLLYCRIAAHPKLWAALYSRYGDKSLCKRLLVGKIDVTTTDKAFDEFAQTLSESGWDERPIVDDLKHIRSIYLQHVSSNSQESLSTDDNANFRNQNASTQQELGHHESSSDAVHSISSQSIQHTQTVRSSDHTVKALEVGQGSAELSVVKYIENQIKAVQQNIESTVAEKRAPSADPSPELCTESECEMSNYHWKTSTAVKQYYSLAVKSALPKFDTDFVQSYHTIWMKTRHWEWNLHFNNHRIWNPTSHDEPHCTVATYARDTFAMGALSAASNQVGINMVIKHLVVATGPGTKSASSALHQDAMYMGRAYAFTPDIAGHPLSLAAAMSEMWMMMVATRCALCMATRPSTQSMQED